MTNLKSSNSISGVPAEQPRPASDHCRCGHQRGIHADAISGHTRCCICGCQKFWSDISELRAAIKERLDAVEEYRSNPAITSRRCGEADEGLRAALQATSAECRDNNLTQESSLQPSPKSESSIAGVPARHSGDLWLDSDGTANFKFHIEGGDFTAARHALEKFIACLQDRLTRSDECPYSEQVENRCKRCGKDFFYSYEADVCPQCFAVEPPQADPPAGVPAEPTVHVGESLLRNPVVIDLMKACEVCGGPYRACDCAPSPLVVTRNGMPCPDQQAALKEFWQQCEKRCVHGFTKCAICESAEWAIKIGEARAGVPAEGEGQSPGYCNCLMPLGSKTCHHCKKQVKPHTRTNSINTECDELRFALEGMVSAYNTDYGDGLAAPEAGDGQSGLSRCDQVRAMQREGGGEVTAVMVSREPERVSSVTEFFDKHPEVEAVMVTRHTETETSLAFKVLKESLQLDSNYAWSWHCNIAMAFYDEARRLDESPIRISALHEVANNAAARFMKLCFEIDVTKSSEWASLFSKPDTSAECGDNNLTQKSSVQHEPESESSNSINTTLPAEDGQSIADATRALAEGHKRLDEAGVPPASYTVCDDPSCQSLIGHRIQSLAAQRDALYEAAVATLKYINNLDGPPVDPKCPECVGIVYYDPSGPEPEMCWVHLVKRAVKIADKNSV